MCVPFWVWMATIALIGGLLLLDFVVHSRQPHTPSLRESASWALFYIALAMLMGLFIGGSLGHKAGVEFLAGYITEKSLSADNLFVFALIMQGFQLPRIHQQRVLLFGIALALLLRTVLILLGATIIEHFAWVFYLFGLFLLVTAGKLLLPDQSNAAAQQPNWMIQWLQRYLPTTSDYHGARLWVRQRGRWLLTPMLLVMLAIATADVVFALDSIPAIYGLTRQPYIVFTANAMALLGLSQLYFLLDGLMQRLVYLSYGLALILAFIGFKLIIEALHHNELSFIHDGQPVTAIPEIPIWGSLGVIMGILALTTLASLLKTKADT